MTQDLHNKNLTFRTYLSFLFKQGFPLSIGAATQTLIALIDVWFIGGIDRESGSYLTGVGAVIPIVILAMSLSSGLGNALTAYLSEHSNESKKFRTNGISTAVILGTVLTAPFLIAGLLFPSQTLGLLGVSGDAAKHGADYLFWITPTILIEMALFLRLGTLLADGKSGKIGKVLVFSSLMNILLNAVFIKVLGMGASGAALGTTLSNLIALLIVLPKGLPTLKPSVFKTTVGSLLHYALPLWVGQGAGALGLVLLNLRLTAYSGDAISGALLAARLEQLVYLPAIGFNGALLASAPGLLKNRASGVRKIIVGSAAFVAFFMTLAVIIPLLFLARPFFNLFTESSEVLTIAMSVFRCALILLPFSVVTFLLGTVIQSEKRMKTALWITLGRTLFPPITAVLVSYMFTSQLQNLWIGYGIGFVLSMILVVTLLGKGNHKLQDETE